LPVIIKAIPYVLRIVSAIMQRAHDDKMIGLGEAKAMEKTAAAINAIVAEAKAAAEEAERRHASDPTDDAFDRSFERKD
jgi:hypothetical protein